MNESDLRAQVESLQAELARLHADQNERDNVAKEHTLRDVEEALRLEVNYTSRLVMPGRRGEIVVTWTMVPK